MQVLSFFTISVSAALCLMSICFTVLVMVWGTQLRPGMLGISESTVFEGEL